jgi:hypothetical protein
MKLTLRDLFWLTVVVTMSFFWWIDHNVLLMGTGMCEESRRAMLKTLEDMRHALETSGLQWEPTSKKIVKKE